MVEVDGLDIAQGYPEVTDALNTLKAWVRPLAKEVPKPVAWGYESNNNSGLSSTSGHW